MKLLLLLPALMALVTAGCDRVESAVSDTPPAGKPATNAPAAMAASTNAAKDLANGPVADSAAPDNALPAAPPELPADVQEVVQLAQNTLGEQVLIDFVATIDQPFSLSADHVIYLKDLGIPETVIAALLKRQVALGGEAVDLPESEIAEGGTTNAPVEAKLALTNAPGANLGLATATAPAPPQPNAPMVGETPGAAPAPEPAPQPTTTVNYNVFYSSLSPYGTWVEASDYGWCWQPTVGTINVGWRPYCDNGRWVWTSGGWYWHSYYSWGWAPFHYGRWCQVPARGWCWVPGTTWGPSWVTWRHCDDHFGWAPLPPACGWQSGVGLTYHGSGVSVGFSFGLGARDYCFVPRARFYDPHCYRFRAAHHDVVGIYGRSTVVNNYIVGDNNKVIVNNGFGRDTVQRHSRSEIRPVALADARQPGRGRDVGVRTGGPRDRIDVYRPTIPVNSIGTRPPETVLARQETRPKPGVGASAIRPTEASAGSRFVSSRPALQGQTAVGGGTRTEVRPSITGGSTRSGNTVTPATSPRASQTVRRPVASGTLTSPTAGIRSESRPTTIGPANPNTQVTRPAVGARVDTRPNTSVTTPSGQVAIQPAPGTSTAVVTRPTVGRSEARPLPQQQITVRRDTPTMVSPQPTVGVSRPTYSRPDFSNRTAPATAVRQAPTYTPAPVQSRPIVQPQYQQSAPRIAPQATAPVRSYSPPAQSVQGGSGGRPSGGRTQPQ